MVGVVLQDNVVIVLFLKMNTLHSWPFICSFCQVVFNVRHIKSVDICCRFVSYYIWKYEVSEGNQVLCSRKFEEIFCHFLIPVIRAIKIDFESEENGKGQENTAINLSQSEFLVRLFSLGVITIKTVVIYDVMVMVLFSF